MIAKVGVILGLACAATGCVTTIRPPADPRDPVVAVLVDYGYHSSLILPTPGGGSVEYAYGEWDYFALNDDGVCNGIIALCCSGQGTLGRRILDAGTDTPELRSRVWCEELYRLKIARGDVEALLAKLEERYGRHLDTRVSNPQNGLTFVQDDESYCCFNNCNHVALGWLTELGCEVSGCGCFANFRIEPPREKGEP